jgi:hypothetical protein
MHSTYCSRVAGVIRVTDCLTDPATEDTFDGGLTTDIDATDESTAGCAASTASISTTTTS